MTAVIDCGLNYQEWLCHCEHKKHGCQVNLLGKEVERLDKVSKEYEKGRKKEHEINEKMKKTKKI